MAGVARAIIHRLSWHSKRNQPQQAQQAPTFVDMPLIHHHVPQVGKQAPAGMYRAVRYNEVQ